MSNRDPRERFSDRVEDYVRYRPGYPPEVLAILRDELGLVPNHVVADVGSGTGIFSKLLLENGNLVYGVEPNAAMRAAAEKFLAGNARFVSINGGAEATTLASASVDLVTCAQAFHWFEPGATREEFRRIVRPGGSAALLWNTREIEGDPFALGYENLVLKYGTDYRQMRHDSQKTFGAIAFLFEARGYVQRTLKYVQALDFEQVKGRLLSASYIPKEPGLKLDALLGELREIFDRAASKGLVEVAYKVELYLGAL